MQAVRPASFKSGLLFACSPFFKQDQTFGRLYLRSEILIVVQLGVSGCVGAMASVDDYDDLSKEEREARDKEDRARESAEQAGTR
jgi:hypothetical protein